jgi:hypothetical protein
MEFCFCSSTRAHCLSPWRLAVILMKVRDLILTRWQVFMMIIMAELRSGEKFKRALT